MASAPPLPKSLGSLSRSPSHRPPPPLSARPANLPPTPASHPSSHPCLPLLPPTPASDPASPGTPSLSSSTTSLQRSTRASPRPCATLCHPSCSSTLGGAWQEPSPAPQLTAKAARLLFRPLAARRTRGEPLRRPGPNGRLRCGREPRPTSRTHPSPLAPPLLGPAPLLTAERPPEAACRCMAVHAGSLSRLC